jgi:hypothetical protein
MKYYRLLDLIILLFFHNNIWLCKSSLCCWFPCKCSGTLTSACSSLRAAIFFLRAVLNHIIAMGSNRFSIDIVVSVLCWGHH